MTQSLSVAGCGCKQHPQHVVRDLPQLRGSFEVPGCDIPWGLQGTRKPVVLLQTSLLVVLFEQHVLRSFTLTVMHLGAYKV
jgi:hypothetical protein